MECDNRLKHEVSNYITKDMYHTIMKLVLLTMVKEHKTYAYDMLKHVAKRLEARHFPHGGNIKNDIYNTMSALENAGYIRMTVKVERHRAKKYYTITPRGLAALKDSKRVFSSAFRSINGILR